MSKSIWLQKLTRLTTAAHELDPSNSLDAVGSCLEGCKAYWRHSPGLSSSGHHCVKDCCDAADVIYTKCRVTCFSFPYVVEEALCKGKEAVDGASPGELS